MSSLERTQSRPVASTARIGARAAGRSLALFVCSARPRAGKTLVARLLIDYFRTRSRPLIAYVARAAFSAAAAHSSSSKNSATRSMPRTFFSGANTSGFGGTGSFIAAR